MTARRPCERVCLHPTNRHEGRACQPENLSPAVVAAWVGCVRPRRPLGVGPVRGRYRRLASGMSWSCLRRPATTFRIRLPAPGPIYRSRIWRASSLGTSIALNEALQQTVGEDNLTEG
jgi:hypothetical protein